MAHLTKTALILGLAAMPALAFAQTSSGLKLDPNSPVDIQSGSSYYSDAACRLELGAKVQITQKQTRLIGQSAVAVANKVRGKCGDMSRIDVDKDVFYVTPDLRVRANHALYDLNAEKVIFTGDVVTVRGADVATGSKLTVDLKTNDATMEGPVRGLVIPPKDKPGQGAGK